MSGMSTEGMLPKPDSVSQASIAGEVDKAKQLTDTSSFCQQSGVVKGTCCEKKERRASRYDTTGIRSDFTSFLHYTLLHSTHPTNHVGDGRALARSRYPGITA